MNRLALILLALSPSLQAASWSDLPMVTFSEVETDAVKKDLASLQPWKPGAELPITFKDAGLESPVRLVACSLYFDGGSRFYLFRGSNGKFLVLCADAGAYYSDEKKKMERVVKPRLFLGAFHLMDPERSVVPPESPTERFLVAAIKAEVSRIKAGNAK